MKILLTTILYLIGISGANAAPKHLVTNINTDVAYEKALGNISERNEKVEKEFYESDKEKNEQILKEARDLESVMISVMAEPMFPKDDGSGIYGGGHGADIYRMMMVQNYGKILSEHNGLGVAENIAKSLNKEELK